MVDELGIVVQLSGDVVEEWGIVPERSGVLVESGGDLGSERRDPGKGLGAGVSRFGGGEGVLTESWRDRIMGRRGQVGHGFRQKYFET